MAPEINTIMSEPSEVNRSTTAGKSNFMIRFTLHLATEIHTHSSLLIEGDIEAEVSTYVDGLLPVGKLRYHGLIIWNSFVIMDTVCIEPQINNGQNESPDPNVIFRDSAWLQ